MRLEDIRIAGRVLWDRLTGGFTRAGRELAREIKWGEVKPDQPTVLCLKRALFAKDIAELQKRTSLNLPCIHVVPVKRAQTGWVAARWQRQSHLWHDLNDGLASLRPHLEAFGVAFLAAASAQHRIDAVVAANTDYWQDEALRMGCRKLGIPFIVLSRESYGIGRGRQYVNEVYAKGQFYFNGAGCAVASPTCRQFLASQPAMRDAEIRTTGWPRYDAWRDYVMPPLAARNWVTLMAYGDPAQVQYAAANFRDVLKVVAKAAEQQLSLPPERRLHFVIKIKKGNEDGYIHAIEPNLSQLGINIIADMPLPEIVARSRLIIGFNTLAVLEGLLGHSAVAVPVWSDSDRDPAATLLHPDNVDDASVCYFPRAPEELARLIEQSAAGDLPAKGTEEQRLARFSRHSLVDRDVTASARFEAFVRDIIAR